MTGQRVLVVEDESAVRALVVKGLESLGYRTLEAADALSALTVLRREPDVDLLLTDVVLPGGPNGTDLAEQVEVMRPKLPVLFMSGYAENVLSPSTPYGRDIELVQKPFTRQQLARAVARALNAPIAAAGLRE